MDGSRPDRMAPALLLAVGLLGLVASLILALDQLVLAANPEAKLGCSLNSVFDCATVANDWAARALFDVPNAFWGLMLQPVIVTVAAALLGGTRFPRWFMTGMWLLLFGAVGYAHWLLVMSTFVIHALCIWCLTLFACTVLAWYALTRQVILADELLAPAGLVRGLSRAVSGGWLEIAVVAWLVIIVVVEAAVWLPGLGGIGS